MALKETIFPSKNAGLADTSQMDVGAGVVFDWSFALAVAFRAPIRQMQKNSAVGSVAGRDM